MTSLRRRLTLGVTGQAALRLVYAANTIGLVPVLVRGWGLQGYGEWIALTALASYLSYSNFGLVTTSANEMVMAAGADDRARAGRGFQMSINLALYIVLPLIVAILGLLSFLPLDRILHLTTIGWHQAFLVLALSGSLLWLQTLRGLIVAALYASGSYGFAYYVSAACKLAEFLCIAAAVGLYQRGQVAAAAIMGAAGLADLAIIGVHARRHVSWARFDPLLFDPGWLRRQIKPAIGFAASNLATHGILIQGPRVVLGALLGGSAVAIYAIYGTAMRLADQLVMMLMLPMEIEIAHAAGAGDRRRLTRLVAISSQLCWIMFCGAGIALMAFGPMIFDIWTRHRVAFAYSLMGLYLAMSAANQLGRVSAHALNGTNRMFGPSFLMLGSSALAVCAGGVMALRWGVAGMVVGGILGEAINSAIVIAALSRWLGSPLREMLGGFFDLQAIPSLLHAWRRRRIDRSPSPEAGSTSPP